MLFRDGWIEKVLLTYFSLLPGWTRWCSSSGLEEIRSASDSSITTSCVFSSYRNRQRFPMVLVGTQDAISAANPRVIDDARARKLSNDLKRSTYYETCSTYGLNVERVFQDVAQKVVALRKKQQLSIGPCKSLPNSPSHSSVPAASIPSVHINQAANGGGAFSDYSSSVPSTPSISRGRCACENRWPPPTLPRHPQAVQT
ncbi:hypothetical protein cypCar_00049009, partial [Cyprinus carpio]